MASLDIRKQQLLEKYWAGETSLKEEAELRKLMDGSDEGLSHFFNEAKDLKEKTIELNVRQLIQEHSSTLKKDKAVVPGVKRIQMRAILAYAATFLLLISAYFGFQNIKPHPIDVGQGQETFDDPELALEQTEAALAFLMTKMNKGQKPAANSLKRIETLDVIIPK